MFKNVNDDSERETKGPKRNPEKSGSGKSQTGWL